MIEPRPTRAQLLESNTHEGGVAWMRHCRDERPAARTLRSSGPDDARWRTSHEYVTYLQQHPRRCQAGHVPQLAAPHALRWAKATFSLFDFSNGSAVGAASMAS